MSAIQNQLGALKGAAGKAMQHTSGTAKDKQLEGVTRYDAEKGNALTTNFGVKVASDDTTLYANGGGKQGPTLIAEDFHFREKVNHFDHERIPERVVHARGSAAHGTFKLTSDKLKPYTMAPILTDTSRTTPVFTRFSTVLGSSGSSDTPRDVRGFAVKMYTQEGNWDIVGNNIPVFFIQDAIKFADVIHAGKPEPHNAIPQAQTAHDNFWDFISLSTEAAHMVMWTMADRTLPRTLRQMQGFGVNTFSLVNSEGKRTLCKFHWAPLLGVHSTIWDETLKLGGADPDFQRRDLYESIESGAFPKWNFGVQLMDEADWDNHSFDPHDATKIWPEEDFPIHWVGEMELNRNPAEYFTEVEQVAFGTHHVVPGIDFSDDPLLQGRNFSYLDTQMSRLGGPNFNDIPINRPVCPVFNNQRDGMHRHTINASRVNYHPNRYDSPHVAKAPEGGFQHYAEKILAIKTKLAAPKFKEHFDQATLFYNSMSATEKKHIYQSLSFELGRVDDPTIRQRVVDNVLLQIDYDLAKAVAAEIDCTVPETAPKQNHGRSSKFLSQITSPYTTEHATAATRKVCIVIADGYDAKGVDAVRAALKAASCVTYIVSTRKGTIKASGGGGDIKADFNIYGLRSVLFDGIIVPGGAQSIATLSKNGNAIGFVNEMWKHCKPVAGFGEGADFLKEASAGKWQGVTFDGKSSNVLGVITAPDAGDSTVGKIASAVGVGSGGSMAQFLDVLSKHRVWERETDNVPA